MAIPVYNEEMKKFIHGLLNHLVQSKGSDLFITTGFPPAMKLDGKLTPITDKPLTADHTALIARALMDDKQAEEFDNTKECNFAISLAGVSRFRINVMVQRGAAALVCRVITSQIPKFDNMNLPPDEFVFACIHRKTFVVQSFRHFGDAAVRQLRDRKSVV